MGWFLKGYHVILVLLCQFQCDSGGFINFWDLNLGVLQKRNASGVAFLQAPNANKDFELPVGPMSLDFSQWQDESLFYMPIELSFV